MILIEEDIFFTEFLEEAIPKLMSIESQSINCSNCNEKIYLPIIARKQDIKAFKELIEIAMEYLHEEGIVQKIFDDLKKKINERLNIQ